ncbi:Oxysterol-binding 9 [Micractinium conductrix]|uniref:Oxysterol-binding 9 n=1 Tax=Micractinium conductrix TaxID=554055 RepID=A0A2P6V6G6_9CHLO|nr:Oxysterol-binding 9 [Micractinium conductrix]|eukprot:PSC69671.1 Oxysterol-binding 9 [Micractinium conductrix]
MLSAVRGQVLSKVLGSGSKGSLPDRAPSESDGAAADDFADATEAQLHPDAHEEGGLACTNKELMEAQRRAIVDVIKGLGKNLLAGNLDLLKVSLPVALFEPRSYLQKLADPWVYPRFLRLAAEATDPVERLQWVVTYFIAGFHRAFERWAKPFNPILGETWQASLPDGSRISLEQISHHPPISAFQMQGPHGLYTFTGMSQPSVSYKTNAVKTTARGYRVLDFKDGGRVEVHFPAYHLRGLLYTSAPRGELGGTAEFVDAQHGLSAEVRFGRLEGAGSGVLARSDAFSGTLWRAAPPADGLDRADSSASAGGWQAPALIERSKRSSGGLASGFSMSSIVRSGLGGLGLRSKSSPAIPEAEPLREVLARCTGNWLSHLDWGEDRWWTLAEEARQEWEPEAHPLPSDCRYREDLALLAAGDAKGSQVAKEALEQRQRAEAKLRGIN